MSATEGMGLRDTRLWAKEMLAAAVETCFRDFYEGFEYDKTTGDYLESETRRVLKFLGQRDWASRKLHR